jgi:hypothetical protein
VVERYAARTDGSGFDRIGRSEFRKPDGTWLLAQEPPVGAAESG